MCGIFGIVTKKSNSLPVKSIAKDLCVLSASRGKEASGILFSSVGKTHVVKAALSSAMLIKRREVLEQLDQVYGDNSPVTILGHSRLATNGDPTDFRNNQPVVVGQIAMIHNGIVVNDKKLWKKYFPNKTAPTLDTLTLTHLIQSFRLKTKSYPKAMARLYTEIVGEASIAFFDASTNLVCLSSNTGSLYFLQNKSNLIFASEAYILEQIRNKYFARASYTIRRLKPITIQDFPMFTYPASNNLSHIKIRNLEIDASPLFGINLGNSIQRLSRHVPNYKKISQIPRCTRCILPITMPLINFDQNGVCNYCLNYRTTAPQGKAKLLEYIEPYRSKNGKPDCIVALSGGRDSAYGLHYTKNVLKLHPIAYTYDWGMVTDIARRNQSRLTAKLGVEHVVVSADISKKLAFIKKNIHAWLRKPDLGMVTLLMAGDKQAEYYVEELKRKTGIQLVIYCRGNQIEDERFKFGYFGISDGTPGGVLHNLSWKGKLRMLTYYARQFISNPAYFNSSLLDTFTAYMSAYLLAHQFVYLWHYVPWNEEKIVSTLRSEYDWETPTDTIVTWRIDDGTPPFYNYIYYQVQGFTEHDGLRSNQIREGIMSRERALKLVQQENIPRYKALKWYFDRVGIDGDKALSIIDAIPRLY